MPRDPLAWQPLVRHWTHCLGEGGSAIARLGDLEAVPDLDLAALLPGGPGWADVQRCLRHDPDGAFRTLYYALALRGLEALPAPALLVEPESQQRPRVSVLIPVHNHWPITLNALRSLVVMANGTPFEVILADDASTDATTQFGQQLPWLRIWRSDHNQGFLDTCNGAAVLARGDILLLLNNDVLVADHCLDQIVATFESHPDAGVVGAASWGPDGRPLEVGGIVWADGQVWNHGRGFPPEHWFALEYERQCDYVSGCALAIHRELWQQLEGFDPRYRPAYCEDTDLCLRVRQSGLSVWVQPAARILHLEGLSHSRSTEQGLKAHQLRNLEQLMRQWQLTLDTQQPPAGYPSFLAADRALLGRPLALLLQPSIDAITACRNHGYGVLALGEISKADVLGLPLLWQEPDRWLLKELLEGSVTQVVLVGVREGEAEELVRHLQEARPEWPLLACAEELPPYPDPMQLQALPGWDRENLRILASSSGLYPDGWLATSSRLVIQLRSRDKFASALNLELFLPEAILPESNRTVSIRLTPDGSSVRKVLRPGLNSVLLSFSTSLPQEATLVIALHGGLAILPANPSDKRRLLAVLVRLECCHAGDIQNAENSVYWSSTSK